MSASSVKITVRIPAGIAKMIDELVEAGLYSNRSEVVKEALREFVLSKKIPNAKSQDEDEEFIKSMLKVIEPILAEDWNNDPDDYVGGVPYEP
ncbi:MULTISPECIES: ribbon-helix-helix domain-containing protein [Thermococcus]|uniref:Ribbon-helix-helix protein CopG domain-containing protein n=1 Tax=Thermococcus barophilus TaxID=55802 RepID=A0A0S1XBZ9_THEBA|nr:MULTISPECIES: ribbon-helix-helix domain-containing protein [Thermococcus]ALM75330.1 hypothetical protein TBCH5v1_1413 [Thermococcus barophilus]WRS53312.1 ribbon-helix-helix domain-containing protein [Thermococcus sp. SY098]